MDLRLIGMCDALALGRFRSTQAMQPLAEQCHTDWLVREFVLSGQQRLVVNGRTTVVHGGQMVRILPGQRYSTGPWLEQKGAVASTLFELEANAPRAGRGLSSEIPSPDPTLCAEMP